MANANNVRRTITNLRDPQQIRELNRQLEWIWNQLLGGLTERAFSALGKVRVSEVVQERIAENINADDASVLRLKASLANLMVATIAVAHIDWASIADLTAEMARIAQAKIDSANIDYAQIKAAQIQGATIENLINYDAVADRYFIRKLQVLSAQILSAMVGDFIFRASDGNYYRLDVGADGSVTPTLQPAPSAAEIEAGETEDGYVISETDLTFESISGSNIKALHAIIDDIFATRLYANEAFVANLFTQFIQGDEFIQVSTAAGDAKASSDSMSELLTVDQNGLNVWNYFIDASGNRALGDGHVLLSSLGLSVLLNGRVYSEFAANYAQFGNYRLRRSADGGLAFDIVSSGDSGQ